MTEATPEIPSRPTDLITTVLCTGHVAVAAPNTLHDLAFEYVRMIRAAIMGVDARGVLSDDVPELPEAAHVVSVTWYHNSVHVNSGQFACAHQ